MANAVPVITGLGLACSAGSDAASAWKRILSGEAAFRPLTLLETADGAPVGGQCAEPPDHLLPRSDREIRLLRKVIDDAASDAGLAHAYPGARVGVVLGTTLHGMRRAGEFLRSRDPAKLARFLAGSFLAEAVSGTPWTGPSFTTCSACSSGLGSIALGITLLESRLVDAVLVGGYDPVSEYAHAGFASLRLIAEHALLPFCKERDGMKLAEGYGIVVLERSDGAAARNARCYASVLGFGESADAHHLTQPHPTGDGALRAARYALAAADIRPEQIDLIMAHATGTPNNDGAEANAYATLFGDRLPDIPVSAAKSLIGHTLGGAGAIELILAAMALREQTVPPSADLRHASPEFPAISLSPRPRPAAISHTLNTSLGFGGANTCMVLAPPHAMRPQRSAPRRDVLITGVGALLPGALGNEAVASHVRAGAGIATKGDTRGFSDDALAPFINTRRARRLSDYVKVVLAAADIACRDAQIADVASFAAECSVILGTMMGSTGYSEQYYGQIVAEGPKAANPVLFAEGVPNAGSAQLSLMLGIKGACQTIIGTRTAGVDAVGLAAERIASGLWERAIVGAGEEYSALVSSVMAECGVRSDVRAEPFTHPAGTPTGAGGAVFVLESPESATRRGARIRGRIDGWRCARAQAHSDDALATAVDTVLAGWTFPAVISSACGTRLDRAELQGVCGTTCKPVVLSSLCGHAAECFSAGPLVSIAATLLSAQLPRLITTRSDWPEGCRPAGSAETVRQFASLTTDWSGFASSLLLRLEA